MSVKQKLRVRTPPRSLIRSGTAAALSVLIFSSGAMTPIPRTAAQSSELTGSIQVAAEIRIAPAVVSALPIKIAVGADFPPQAMLLVHGLPARVTLSEGRSFGTGVWAVPLANVGRLEIAPATGTSGKTSITFELVTLEGKILAQAKSSLQITPLAAEQRKAPQSTANSGASDAIALTAGSLPTDDPAPPAALGDRTASLAPEPRLTPEQSDHFRKLIERGDELMQSGKVSSARLLYQSAAEGGSAEAALALAETYDGSELVRWKVMGGIQPDLALAKKWYQKAKQLGSPEADGHLLRLSTR
jgi:hypothetical protein